MTLFEKSSIVLTPTAYSDGSLNTVIPPYQVFEERVTNGDFSDGTNNWVGNDNTTLSVSNGQLDIQSINASSIYGVAFTEVNFVEGKKYIVKLDVISTDRPTQIRVGTSNGIITGTPQNIFASGDIGIGSHEIVYTATSTDTYLSIGGRNDMTTLVIDNVSVKEIQEADFDFSRGSSATRVNEKGLIEDVASNIPRIDYTSGQGALLLEPQRTNLITNSEKFVDAPTGNTNMDVFFGTITNNDTTSPDGNNNGMRFTINTGSGATLRIYQADLSTSADTTFSLYAKKGTTDSISIGITGGTVTSVTLTDEWQRISVTGVSTSQKFLDVNISGNSDEYIYMFGLQAEAGSYATSYIPTEGSTVTRSADVANNSGNADLFNDSEGVLYAQIAALANDGTFRNISLSDGTTNNRFLLQYINSSNILRVETSTSSGTAPSILSIILSNVTNNTKTAFKYKDNDFAFWVNGFEADSVQVGDNPINLSRLGFDSGAGIANFYGNTKGLAVFKEALTDAELESLTSWVSFVEMATDLEYTLE